MLVSMCKAKYGELVGNKDLFDKMLSAACQPAEKDKESRLKNKRKRVKRNKRKGQIVAEGVS